VDFLQRRVDAHHFDHSGYFPGGSIDEHQYLRNGGE
jgi:hypothetical protein